jgi:hypothetical protein
MTIVKRGTKGSALTYNEMDENIRDLYEDTTINRVLENDSGSGSDAQYLTWTPPAGEETYGFINVNHNARIKFPGTNADGGSFCCSNILDLNNHNIIGVNHLAFSDPGPSEGLIWSNTKIFESPDDLTTNEAGNLQVTYGGNRKLTVSSDGIEVLGTITSGDITVGDASTDNKLRAHFNDGSYTDYKGFGIEFNRETCYIRPTSDGNKDLNLGAHDASKDWRNINIKSTSGTYFTGPVIIPTFTPASASANGTAGRIAWDDDYIYVCTATNTWKRAALETW